MDGLEEEPLFVQAKRAQQRRLLAAVVMVVLAAAAIASWSYRSRPVPVAVAPGPLFDALSRTQWFPTHRPGYTRLDSMLDGMGVLSGAVGRDGTIAFAGRVRAGEDWAVRVLIWRDGEISEVSLPSRSLGAMAVEPDGRVLVVSDGQIWGLRAGQAPVLAAGPFGADTLAIAVSPVTDRVALLTRQAAYFGDAPLSPDRLRELPLVSGPDMTTIAVDYENRVVIGGDAATIFRSEGHEWRRSDLPVRGDVEAFGFDPMGRLLVGLDHGNVMREDGVSWELIDAIPGHPVAIGSLPELGVVVATDGGQTYATLGREELSKVSRFPERAGYKPLLSGHELLYLTDGAFAVTAADGRQLTSLEDRVEGDDACAPLPRSLRALLRPLGLMRCGDRFALPTRAGYEFVDEISLDGENISGAELVAALDTVEAGSGEWSRRWAFYLDRGGPLAARLGATEGGLRLAVRGGSAVSLWQGHGRSDGDAEVWAFGADDHFYYARVSQESTEVSRPTKILDVADFMQGIERVLGIEGQIQAARASVSRFEYVFRQLAMYPAGDERLLLTGTVVVAGAPTGGYIFWVRMSPDGSLEELEIAPSRVHRLVPFDDMVLRLRQEGVDAIGPTGAAIPWDLGDHVIGSTYADIWPDGNADYDLDFPRPGVIRAFLTDYDGTSIVECRNARCVDMEVPAGLTPRGLASTEDGIYFWDEIGGSHRSGGRWLIPVVPDDPPQG